MGSVPPLMTGIDWMGAPAIPHLDAHNTPATSVAATLAGAVQPSGQADDHRHTVGTARPISLSEWTQSMATARAAVDSAPDVRQEKIAAIKQRLDEGAYQLSAQALARGLWVAG